MLAGTSEKNDIGPVEPAELRGTAFVSSKWELLFEERVLKGLLQSELNEMSPNVHPLEFAALRLRLLAPVIGKAAAGEPAASRVPVKLP